MKRRYEFGIYLPETANINSELRKFILKIVILDYF